MALVKKGPHFSPSMASRSGGPFVTNPRTGKRVDGFDSRG